ncbi:MAG: hypothetical protein ACE5GU_12740 [Candidatus Scalinduaceae bacterium]
MYRTTKLLTLAFFLGALLFGSNAFAGKSVDWPGFAAGANSLAVIEGKIKSLDLEKMNITLEESEMLGNEPLFLGKDTTCYMGDAKTDIISIRGGTEFQKEDELSFDYLKAGDYVKCNYSIRDGKFWAVRIVLITPYLKVE